MTLEYMGLNIPLVSVSGLCLSERTDTENVNVIEAEIINSESNRAVTAGMFGFVTFRFRDVVLNEFKVVRDSIRYTDDSVTIQFIHNIDSLLSTPCRENFVYADANPADVIFAALFPLFGEAEDGGINYLSTADFRGLRRYFDDIGERIDVCYTNISEVSWRDIIAEICGKVGLVMFTDYVSGRLRFHNIGNLPVDCIYNPIPRKLVMSKTESVSDSYYNSFKIGIYPDTYVMQQIRYKYKCWNSNYSDVWFDEDDIELTAPESGTVYSVRLLYKKYDISNSIIYEDTYWHHDSAGWDDPANPTRQAITSNVSEEVQKLATYSATTLYGDAGNPAWSVWEDENIYSEIACCRHTGADGAVRLGNSIVKRYWRKAKKLSLDVAKFLPVINGDILTFEDMNWVLIHQEIKKDMSATLELEELIDDKMP